MKKYSVILLAALCAFLLTAACGESNDPENANAAHTHTIAYRYAEEDETSHWRIAYCTNWMCGEELGAELEDHSLSKGFCSLCGYVCLHEGDTREETVVHEGSAKYDGTYIVYDVTVVTYCEDCGGEVSRRDGTVSEIHQIHSQPQHISWMPNGKYDHIEVVKCGLCGQTYQLGGIPHEPEHLNWFSAGEEEGDIELVRCSVCGEVYEKAPVAHDWAHDSWQDKGYKVGHAEAFRCLRCGITKETQTVGHTMKNGYCTVCLSADHVHKVQPSTSGNAGCEDIGDPNVHVYFLVCKICGAHFDKRVKSHTYPNYNFSEKCGGCGYLKDGCEHSIVTLSVRSDYTQDVHTVEAVCGKCGKTITREEKHSFVCKQDEKLHWDECKSCGYRINVAAHELSYSVINCICFPCGYIQHIHGDYEWTYGEWRMNDEKEEMRSCYCGYPGCEYNRREVQPHSIAVTGTEQIENDHVYHYVVTACSSCKDPAMVKRIKAEHRFVDGVCDECGYTQHVHRYTILEQSTVNPHIVWDVCECGDRINRRTTEHEYAVVYEPIDGISHRFSYCCSVCGDVNFSTVEDHLIEQQACVRCKYRMDEANDFAVAVPSAEAEPERQTEAKPANAKVLPISENSVFHFLPELPEAVRRERVLSIDGRIAETTLDVKYLEETDSYMAVIVPESVPEDGFYELLLTYDYLEALDSCGIVSLSVRIRDEELLLIEDIQTAMNAIYENGLDDLSAFFARDPDADENAKGREAYLLAAYPYDLYEEKT